MLDYLYEILEHIRNRLRQTIASCVGIAWGIFILVILIGVGVGFKEGVLSLFSGYSVSTTYVYALATSISYKGTGEGKKINFSEKDVLMLRDNIPEINSISPEVGEWMVVSHNGVRSRYEVKGVFPEYFNIKLVEADRGRLLNMLDMQESRNVVLIGSNVEDVLFENDKIIGNKLMLNNELYTVVGTIKKGMTTASEERVIYMPLSTYHKHFSNSKMYSLLLYTTKGEVVEKEIQRHFSNLMSRKYQYDPNDDKALFFSSMQEQVKAFNELFSVLTKFLWFMGLSTLLSGVIGVANIMYASAKERTREIGIRKSVGATSGSVKFLFLFESLFITIVAGVSGLGLGSLVLVLIRLVINGDDNTLMSNPAIDLKTALTALAILIISGTLAGVKPAIYAAKLNPIEALKDED